MSAGAALRAQVPFDQAIRDLTSPDVATRLRTVQMLRDAAYLEAAAPLARLLLDPDDQVQLEAVAAELNIFLAEPVVTRRRVGLVVERRTPILADAAFSAGPPALGPRPVPIEVLAGLRAAVRDDNPRVGLEALYAFGTLAVEPVGQARADVLRASGPELAALLGSPDPAFRYGALRVLGRVFARRPGDAPIEPGVGDPIVSGLNDKDVNIRLASTDALGAMRYERALQSLTDLVKYYGRGALAAASLDAVARIAHASSEPVFAGQLTGKDAMLKGIAIEGLARLGDRARWADIQGATLRDRGDEVRLALSFAAVRLANAPIDPIVDALARQKLHDQAFGYLVELAGGGAPLFGRRLQDPMPRIRRELVDAIGLSHDPALAPLVAPMAADPDVAVARAVERALARLRASR